MIKRDVDTGKTLFRTIIPLYASALIEYQGFIYAFGDNHGFDHDEAVISVIDKETGAIVKNHIFKNLRAIHSAALNGDSIVLAAIKSYPPATEEEESLPSEYEIMTFDTQSERVQSFKHPFVVQLFEDVKIRIGGNLIYGITDERIFAVNFEGICVGSFDTASAKSYNEQLDIVDGHLYAVSREDQDDTTFLKVDEFDLDNSEWVNSAWIREKEINFGSARVSSLSFEIPREGNALVLIKPNLG